MTTPESCDVAVIGGGIAGLACAVALAESGRRPIVFERKGHLGGRATSFPAPETGEDVDNCQHIILGCCTNVADFFKKIGAGAEIDETDAFTYVTPDAERHRLRPSFLPAPTSFLPALLKFGALRIADRANVIAALLRVMLMNDRALERVRDLTMMDWLRSARQTERSIERFWRPILVSAVNEDIEKVAAWPCLQVIAQGFLPHRRASRMGVPRKGLHAHYAEPAARFIASRGGEVRRKSKVERILFRGDRATGIVFSDERMLRVQSVVTAIPADMTAELFSASAIDIPVPEIPVAPITGVHLWFDRDFFDVPHAVMLDTTIQWLFKKAPDAAAKDIGATVRISAVVSASRSIEKLSQSAIVETAIREIGAAFPASRAARCVKSMVIKENRATISATPAVERRRPPAATKFENIFLAGDWTQTGWPSTLEGSVRSGRIAAEKILDRNDLLVPDLPRSFLAKLLLARLPHRWPSSPR